MPFVKIYRFILGVLIFIAIFIQAFSYHDSLINFFSYVTILSNLFAALVLLFSITKIIPLKIIDHLRGAAILYLLITFLGFIFLLGGKNDELLSWVSILFHYVAPLIILLDWIFTSRTHISFQKAFLWIAALVIYLLYLLFRSIFTHWYAYPFLNTEKGTGGMLPIIGGLFLGTSLLTFALIKLPSWTHSLLQHF